MHLQLHGLTSNLWRNALCTAHSLYIHRHNLLAIIVCAPSHLQCTSPTYWSLNSSHPTRCSWQATCKTWNIHVYTCIMMGDRIECHANDWPIQSTQCLIKKTTLKIDRGSLTLAPIMHHTESSTQQFFQQCLFWLIDVLLLLCTTSIMSAHQRL